MLDQATARATMKWQVAPGHEPIRLDAFVRECLPHLSRREVDQAIRDGFFSIDGHVARKGDRLSAGDRLVFNGSAALLAANPLPDTSLDVPIVYEDSSIFIVDKPAGIATHGFSGRDTGTLANYIAAQHPHLLGVGKNRWEPGLVHRLDSETSGLVLVAKTQTAFDRLRQQFRRRQVAKIYWALVWGTTNAAGVIDLPLAHDPRDKRRMRAVSKSLRMKKIKTWKALTRYRKVGQSAESTLLEITMETGVTHQIRVHLAAIGHPIVADALYGDDRMAKFDLQRHFLHACRLEFRHPEDGRVVKLETKLPGDLTEILRRLKMEL
jgi:23S rRNA pseudouridine1911/1915/1917 synthase